MRGITTTHYTTTTPMTDQEKKEQAIKAIRMANCSFIVTSTPLDEPEESKIAATGLIEGNPLDIINMLTNAMRQDGKTAMYIVAASAMFLGSQE